MKKIVITVDNCLDCPHSYSIKSEVRCSAQTISEFILYHGPLYHINWRKARDKAAALMFKRCMLPDVGGSSK